MARDGFLSLGIFVDDLVGLNGSDDPNAFRGLAASLESCFEVKVTVLDKFWEPSSTWSLRACACTSLST